MYKKDRIIVEGRKLVVVVVANHGLQCILGKYHQGHTRRVLCLYCGG